MYSRVYVEITNICNMNCSFCHGHSRKAGKMSTEEFSMVLDKLEEVAADDGKTEEEWRKAYLYPLMEKYDSTPSCCKGWHFALNNFWILGSYSEEEFLRWKVYSPQKYKFLPCYY